MIGSLNNGGSQSLVMNLYRNIDRTQVQFDFIIDRPDELFYASEIEELGGKIFTMPLLTSTNLPKYLKVWNRFFIEHPEYHVIHGHVRSTAFLYLSVAKKNGLVAIAHSHNTSSGKGYSAVIKKILQFPIRYKADYFFSCSEAAGVWLFGEKVTKKKNYYLFNNAINTDLFAYNPELRENIRNELSLKDKFVIGHVGRFHSQKNHMFLIDVFKKVYDKKNNAVLLLVGDGELRSEIEARIKELGLTNNVILTGVKSNINELLQAMDIFVFPSLYEGLGIVAIEAQAAGLNCIVSEKIPSEAFVSELIRSLPLNFSVDKWVENILMIQNQDSSERINKSDLIKKAGYDIKDKSKWIENFYTVIHTGGEQ